MADNHDSDARNGDPDASASGQAPGGRDSSWMLGLGIALGAALGIILGSILDNVGLGLALGILIGIIVVTTMHEWRRRTGGGTGPHD
jgi:uncharacterized membrane protein YfcA